MFIDRSSRCRDIVILGFFRMAADAILIFFNFKFLTVRTVKRVELRNYVKFCRNRSNLGWDMVIFDFSKMAAVGHLGFVMRVLGQPTKGILFDGRYHCAGFMGIDAVVLTICTFFNFARSPWILQESVLWFAADSWQRMSVIISSTAESDATTCAVWRHRNSRCATSQTTGNSFCWIALWVERLFAGSWNAHCRVMIELILTGLESLRVGLSCL